MFVLSPKEIKQNLQHCIDNGFGQFRLSFVLTAIQAIQQCSFNIFNDEQMIRAQMPQWSCDDYDIPED